MEKSGWQSIDAGRVFYNKWVITKAVTDPIRTKDPARIIRTEDYRFDAVEAGNALESVRRVAQGASWIVYMAYYFDVLKEPFKKRGIRLSVS